jgi:type VI secretion system secreted protein VgrG
MMNIRTPLGKDVLLINSFTAEEEISRLYNVVAELVHEGRPGGGAPHDIAPNTIIGKNVCIEVIQRDGTARFFNGVVNRFEQRNRENRFTHYEAEIVPQFWLLSQIRQSRIFQQKSVKEIIQTVFNGLNYELKIEGTYEPRNFCVQYRETDLDFAMRLMEEEGIFFYFEHTEQTHKMIIGDKPMHHKDCPNSSTFTWDFEQPDQEDFIATVRGWIVNYRMQTGKVTFWDHHFELPYNKLDASQPTRNPLDGKDKLEAYDYPGGYSRKFDGVDKSGGENASELNKVFPDKTKIASLAMEEIDSRYKIISGASDCSSMTAGHRFNLENHPGSQNGSYVLTSVSHTATQSPDYNSEDTVLDPYDNSFTCIPVGSGAPTFRPGQITPKPTVEGLQTATVVGPAGEEIFTDKYGRVKVQFHWDRHGKNDADSSCWMRVAQNWAGKKWGVMFIPRIGMEVMIGFLEGDPDQPIITGCVYNADTMPPYTLPDEKTKSTIKSNSSKGGGGFNEFRIEDKKGSEQIFIHAEKDQDIRVKNDCKEIILRDRHLIVESKQHEKVKGDKHLEVVGNQNEKVGGSVSLNCGGSQQIKTSQKHAVDAGTEIHLKAGATTVIEAGTSLTLKVGGNFVNINAAGVFVKGTMVMINSGGVAGSGSGSSPAGPEPPKEADKAEPGQRTNVPSPPPPPVPPQFQAMMSAVQAAVQNAPVPAMPSLPVTMPPLPPIPPIPPVAEMIAPAQAAVQAAVQAAQAQAAQAISQVQDRVDDVKDLAQDLMDNAQAYADEIQARAEAARDTVEEYKEEAQQAVQQVADQVHEAAQEAKDAVGQVSEQAQQAVDQAQEAAQEAKEAIGQAQEAAGQAQEAVEQAADDAKEAAAQAQEAAAGMAEAAQNAVPFL